MNNDGDGSDESEETDAALFKSMVGDGDEDYLVPRGTSLMSRRSPIRKPSEYGSTQTFEAGALVPLVTSGEVYIPTDSEDS